MKKGNYMIRQLVLVIILVSLVVGPVQAQGDLNPELRAAIEAIESQVAILRELEPATEIDRVLIAEEALRDRVLEDLLADYTPEQAGDDLIFYNTFGFMTPDVDLYQVTQQVLMEQIAGYYDTELDQMYVLSSQQDRLDAVSSLVYAHEYMHALQDANFDLDELLDEARFENEPDYALAVLSLIEGDAQLMTLQYTEQRLREDPTLALQLLGAITQLQSPALDNAPPIFGAELLFPYEQGMSFATRIFSNSGWRVLNQVYQRPPQSTEQVLHPDIYLLYETPIEVDVRPLDTFFENGDAWRLVRNHPMGEFYIREHLKLFLPVNEAELASAGWGGDRMMLYADQDNRPLVVWKLAWDTLNDMNEFNIAYDVFLTNWTGSTAEVFDDQNFCWWSARFSACKALRGDETIITIAPTTELARDALQFQLEAAPVEDAVPIFGSVRGW